jgi:arylsulfatase A-like enzyme
LPIFLYLIIVINTPEMNTKRFFLSGHIFAVVLLIFVQCSSPKELVTNRPPNIIYILADDMGYGDLGCYGQGTLKTPNIDKLAKEGMKFTQHYAGATVCAPSRSSLLTGKHTGHCSVRGNMPEGQLTKDEEITIPEALKEAGYKSAIIGKWGIGHPPLPDDPLRNGFDHAYGYINMWHAHNFYPEFLFRDGEKVMLEGNETDWSFDYAEDMPEGAGIAKEKTTYVLTEFENDAINFIEQNKENPFFLFLALNMPHANNEAGYFTGNGMEVPTYGEFTGRDWPDPEKGFASMIKLIDNSVGLIQAKINELGLDDTTIIIFASDNGPHQEGGHDGEFFDSNGMLRGFKRDLYEGGVRIPMIVRWPGTVKENASSDHISAFWDVLPTFCDIAGVETPTGIDGISFLPELTGEGIQDKHDYLYWEFYELGGRQAIRQGDWKYVKLNVRDNSKDIITELYNLQNDPGEINNVIDQYPDIAEKMELLLIEAHTPSPFMSLFNSEAAAETRF